MVLFSVMIPISLYVSMEIAKLFQTWAIEVDPEMYDDERKLGAKPKTTSLNEELGQIDFIFSDKTGVFEKERKKERERKREKEREREREREREKKRKRETKS